MQYVFITQTSKGLDIGKNVTVIIIPDERTSRQHSL